MPWAVVGLWVALAVVLPLTFPSLNEMAQKHPLAMLPADAPSSVAAKQMTEAFHEPGGDDLLLVVLTDERGLGPAHEATYRKLVDALRDDQQDVVMLQDFVGTPALRSFLTSKDGKSWVLPVGLAGALGTPAVLCRLHPGGRDRQTEHRGKPAGGPPHRPGGHRRRPDCRGGSATVCRSRSRSPSWCSWCCWWCTAIRSPCCCR